MPARAAIITAKLTDPHLRDPAFREGANESVLLWIKSEQGTHIHENNPMYANQCL